MEIDEVGDKDIGGTDLFFHAAPPVVLGLVPVNTTSIVVMAGAGQGRCLSGGL